MRIKRVDAFLLSCPLPEPLQLTYYGGRRTILKRDSMLIRVETDSGVVGYAPGQASDSGKHLIEGEIAAFLAGRVLADCDALRVQFFASHGNLSRELPIHYACVEIALYDALGKQRGLPVSELLGGRVRDRIKLYASGGMYGPPESYAAEAVNSARLGFPAYKLRPGLGPDEDVEIVRQVREAVGPDLDIMVDAHTWWRMGNRSYNAETVTKLAQRLAEYDVYWLEEPLPPFDHGALRQLRDLEILPIATGEHEPGEEGFSDLISRRCADVIQLDLVCQGGYPAAKRLFAELVKQDLRFAFHSWGTELEVAAAAHVGICWPETTVEWLEYPVHAYAGRRAGMYPFDLAMDILKTRLEIDNGDLIVSTAPGLGVDVDESVIHRYPWIPGPWSTFELIDPPGRFAVTGDHTKPFA